MQMHTHEIAKKKKKEKKISGVKYVAKQIIVWYRNKNELLNQFC